jgi:hypothetical protein
MEVGISLRCLITILKLREVLYHRKEVKIILISKYLSITLKEAVDLPQETLIKNFTIKSYRNMQTLLKYKRRDLDLSSHRGRTHRNCNKIMSQD